MSEKDWFMRGETQAGASAPANPADERTRSSRNFSSLIQLEVQSEPNTAQWSLHLRYII